MFTGIVTSQFEILEIRPDGSHLSARILPGTKSEDSIPAVLGESIALNGVCLTLTHHDEDTWHFDLSPETLARTNLGELKTGSVVNCERSLRTGDRISGHWVQGHVDGVARLTSVRNEKDCHELLFELPYSLGKYCVEKGSLCINGVSLTVNSVLSSRRNDGIEVGVMVIPHTWASTNLSRLSPGAYVNIEVDLLAKYVEKLCRH